MIAGGRVGAAGLIVTVNVAFAVPLALVALIGTVYVPACVGVPERTPLAVLKPSPGGRLLAP